MSFWKLNKTKEVWHIFSATDIKGAISFLGWQMISSEISALERSAPLRPCCEFQFGTFSCPYQIEEGSVHLLTDERLVNQAS